MIVSGMNQLLCALSYYILGAIAEEAEKVTGSRGWPCLEVFYMKLPAASCLCHRTSSPMTQSAYMN